MIESKPIEIKYQALFTEWYKDDIQGKKRIGEYENLEYWINLLNENSRWGWLINIDEVPIGFLDLEKLENEKGGFAFYIAPAFRGKGYSNLLIQELIKLVKEKQIKILYAGVDEDNISSIKVLKKINFSEIGRDKNNLIEFELNI